MKKKTMAETTVEKMLLCFATCGKQFTFQFLLTNKSIE